MREERKLVSVIFADVVGSSALAATRDPEIIRETLSHAFRELSDILRDHGGTVEKYIGDAIMAVFGIPSAHDDDAERAVRAAFKLRDRIRELSARGPLKLEMRIGISSGEAVAGKGKTDHHLVTGPVVNEAARLQTGAAPGGILVGRLTRELTRGAVLYGEPSTIAAKGMGAVDAWPARELKSAQPHRQHGLPGLRAPLIGRERELGQLLEAFERVRASGATRLVTVYGPAGSGKSRLASEFVATVGVERVRAGRCLPYGEGITYYAVQLIVRTDAGIEPGDSRDLAMSKLRSATLGDLSDVEDSDAIARRVAVLAGLARAEDVLLDVSPTDLREELRWGFRRYLERRATAAPLVIVLEDLHWAEPGLLDLITHLAEWSRAALLLLCLARPDLRESSPTWAQGLTNAATMVLDPLDSDETLRLVDALTPGTALTEDVRSEIVSRAEGNPLFVEEILRMLTETGQLQDVPPTLLGLITARIDSVSPPLKYVLQRGSLAGRLFSTEALATLGTGSRPDPAVLREAVRRDLLVQVDDLVVGSGQVFRFKHVLLRDVAYSTVPKSDRSRLHDRYGRWLEESYGDRRNEVAEIVAHHAEQAYRFGREVESPEVGALARRAAASLYLAARNAFDRDDPHAALNLYERTEEVSSAIHAPAAELAEARGYVAVLRRQVATEQRPIEELDAAIAVATTSGPSRVLVELLALRAFESHRFGDPGVPFAAEALAVARALGDPELVAEAMWTQIEVLFPEGDLDAMRRPLDEAVAYVEATGARRARARILLWGSRLARYRGDLTRAAHYRDLLVGRGGGSKGDRGIAALVDCRFRLALGDVQAALAHSREALGLMREVGLPHWTGLCCLHLGDALLSSGAAEAARTVLLEGLEIFVRRGQRRQIPELAARIARANVRLRDLRAARAYADLASSMVTPTDFESVAIAAVALGEVLNAESDLDAADACFRRAIADLRSTGFRSWRAFVEESYAEFLLAHERGAEAEHQLRAAREFHTDPLAVRHRERIDASLARVRAPA